MLRVSFAISVEDFEAVKRAADVDDVPYTTWLRRAVRFVAHERLREPKRKDVLTEALRG